MVKSSSTPMISPQQLSKTLGYSLSPSEFQRVLKGSEFKEPKVGKFWHSGNSNPKSNANSNSNTNPGIYIIIAGKVRLLDGAGELITTLETEKSFGELTLFPEVDLEPYVARASVNVKLCFLPGDLVLALMDRYPQIRDHLWNQARLRDSQCQMGSSEKPATGTQNPASVHAPTPATSLTSGPPQKTKSEKKIKKAFFPHPTQRVGHWFQRVTKRYPFYAQQNASDCGPACLVMVSRYWGKQFSLNRLRNLANVNRDGSSLRRLCFAAESVGFSTRPVQATLDQLAKQKLPAIVHWEGKHFIVVYEITKTNVVVCDPARGQRTLTHREFNKDWSGYALLLQPTLKFKDTKASSTSVWQFFELIKPHWLMLLEIFIASIFLQLFGLVTPIFTQLILDRVVVQRSQITLTTVVLGLVLFSLFRVAMTGLRQYLLIHTAKKIDVALIVGFIRHVFRLPLNFFESRYVGDIVSRVQENRKIEEFMTGETLSIVLDLLTVFIYGGMMFWYNWQMALLALVIVPPFSILALVSAPFLRRISREIFYATTKQNSYLIEALSGVRTVKASAVEQTVRWNWEELLNKAIKIEFSAHVFNTQLQMVSGTLEAFTSTGLLWYGAFLVIQDQLTIGQLVAFNMVLGQFISPFQRLSVVWNQLQEVLIAVERINDVLDSEPEENLQQQEKAKLGQLQGHIQFENVTFRYHDDSDNNVLENLSFEVKPGQMVALVGRSGSGKTTISKLVLGFYPPSDGKVLIDGLDITTIMIESLRSQIGVVDQDTFLFGGTIQENISLCHPSAGLEQVMKAAQLAGAHEFIQQLPMGYDTQIGEGGGMLSGGQRQRIAIARALMGNPKLLVLDEATSHLDPESERIIQRNLNTILKGRTTLVIAHRLSTIRNADLILVMDRGVLIESGTHQELIEKRGHFYYLNQQQLTVAQ